MSCRRSDRHGKRLLGAGIYRPFAVISAAKWAGPCCPVHGLPSARAPRPPHPALQGARGNRRDITREMMKTNGRKWRRWCKVCSVAHSATPTHRRIYFKSERACQAAPTATEMDMLECFIILENDFCLC